jgi:hypothetical protein
VTGCFFSGIVSYPCENILSCKVYDKLVQTA